MYNYFLKIATLPAVWASPAFNSLRRLLKQYPPLGKHRLAIYHFLHTIWYITLQRLYYRIPKLHIMLKIYTENCYITTTCVFTKPSSRPVESFNKYDLTYCAGAVHCSVVVECTA